MTSLRMYVKAMPSCVAWSGASTWYCESSPSPGSPSTKNETSSRSAKFETVKDVSIPLRRWASIQRRRSSSVESPTQRAMRSFRDSQSGFGLIQEKLLRWKSGRYAFERSARSLQAQPAAFREVRDDSTPAVWREVLDGMGDLSGGRTPRYDARRCASSGATGGPARGSMAE